MVSPAADAGEAFVTRRRHLAEFVSLIGSSPADGRAVITERASVLKAATDVFEDFALRG